VLETRCRVVASGLVAVKPHAGGRVLIPRCIAKEGNITGGLLEVPVVLLSAQEHRWPCCCRWCASGASEPVAVLSPPVVLAERTLTGGRVSLPVVLLRAQNTDLIAAGLCCFRALEHDGRVVEARVV
jgi:hypothetical protein